MKRFLYVVSGFLLLLSLTSCAGDESFCVGSDSDPGCREKKDEIRDKYGQPDATEYSEDGLSRTSVYYYYSENEKHEFSWEKNSCDCYYSKSPIGTPSASVTATPSEIDFGRILVGSSSLPSTITIANNGNTSIDVSNISVSDPNNFILTLGTCGESPFNLDPGDTCNVTIAFKPVVTGTFQAPLIINLNNASLSTLTVNLSGEGYLPDSDISVSPTQIDFGEVLVGDSSFESTIAIVNNGSATLDVTNISISDLNDFTLSYGNCGASSFTLAPNSSCNINVSFNPVTAGSFQVPLIINSNDPAAPNLTVSLSGQGYISDSAISVIPSEVNFGSVPVGETSVGTTITIANNGAGTLDISNITLSDIGNFDFSYGTCGDSSFSLDAGDTCNVTAFFNPLSAASLQTQLVINSNDPSNPNMTIPLSGQGYISDAAISVIPSEVNFGSIPVGGTSVGTTITIANNGDGGLNISNISLQDANNFDLVYGTCDNGSFSLDAGDSCNVTAFFNPLSAASLQTQLVINSNDPSVPNLTIPLSGQGYSSDAAISVIPSAINFGSVVVGESSLGSTLAIANNGSGTLNVSSLSLLDTNNFNITYGTCGDSSFSLDAGDTCNVTAFFNPLSAASLQTQLVINSNDPSAPNLTVPLSGQGYTNDPDISVAPTEIDFGNIIVGNDSLGASITIANNGSGDLNISNIGLSDSNNFTLAFGSCGSSSVTLDSGDTCNLTVFFNPLAVGTINSQILINSNDPNQPTMSVDLSGEGYTLDSDVSVSPSAIDFGRIMIGDSSYDATITLFNDGSGDLDVADITIADPNNFTLSFGSCGSSSFSLSSESTCNINVFFSPLTSGNFSAPIFINSNDPAQPDLTVALSGEGYAPEPDISVVPTEIDFGNMTGTPISVIIANTGTEDLSVYNTAVTNPNYFDLAVGTCGDTSFTLSPETTCYVTVTFNAPAGVSVQSNLVMNSNDPDTPTQSIELTGDTNP